MPIAILATGDEIIIGDTLNTNSQQLAHALHSEGLILGYQMACNDQETDIVNALKFLTKQHDIIIITGGLGPTSDDRTRFALAKFMEITLEEYPPAIAHIQKRLHNAQLQMTEGNRQQALFPPNTTLLENPFGTAMGCRIQWNNKLLFLLPGPPRECLPMFNSQILPFLADSQHSNTVLLKWRLFGSAEGQIAQQIDEALASVDCKTGYRLEMPYLECKVICENHVISKVKEIIEPIVAPYIIASPEKKASEKLSEFLAKEALPIAIVDKATGGTLQTLIQNPNNYQWVSFYKRSEVEFYFEINGLENYWQQHNSSEKPSISIRYIHHDKERTEHHQLPYRSSMLLQHAAEWLCYRLDQLIRGC